MSQRHNLIRDPGGVLLTDWSAEADAGTPTVAAAAGTGPLGLSTFARATATTTLTYLGVRIQSPASQSVVANQVYTLSAYVRPATTVAIQSSMIIRFLDAAGSVLQTTTGTPVALTQNTFGRPSATGTAPIGSARADVSIGVAPVSGSMLVGDHVDVSACLLNQATTAEAFFYPGNGVTVFDGAAYASASTEYSPDVTLLPHVDANPCPRVEVTISDISPGVPKIDVYRVAAGREYPMRGGVQAVNAGSVPRVDFEVPFGVPVQYRAEMFDASGTSLGFTETSTVQLDVAETWVHNPLSPQGATTVRFRDTAAKSLKRPHDGDFVAPLGRSVGVVVAGQRRGLVDAALDVFVETLEQADKLQDMFGSYGRRTVPVICFRIGASDRIRLPRPLFAGVLNLDEQGMNYTVDSELIAFGMTGTEVDPPTPALVVPLLTRADLNAAYPTRAALNAAYLTRLAANTDYTLAGTA